MSNYIVCKLMYAEGSKRTYKPGDLIVLSDKDAEILLRRGIVRLFDKLMDYQPDYYPVDEELSKLPIYI